MKDLDTYLNIDTEGFDESKEDFHHNRYEPTSYEVLDRLIESNYINKNSIVVDMGCGKGRIPIYLNYKLNCKTIGLDFNEHLVSVANMNKEKSKINCEFICIDAQKYEITLEDCFYFFNPFSDAILASVLSNILNSYYENPREIKLFFYYPEKDTLALLMRQDHLLCIDEIDCEDIFSKRDSREKIFVFEII